MSGRTLTRARRADTRDWVDYLRERHPRAPAKHVAAATGWPVRTVEKWLSGESRPAFEATTALISAYGPEFLAVLMPVSCGWIAEAARHARLAALDATMAALAAKRAVLAGAQAPDARSGAR